MENKEKKIILGVCAMDNKAQSKAMTAILKRMNERGDFEILMFGDDVILNKPVSEWPVVEALISFFSKGFPLQKAVAYVKMRKPFCINDVTKQHLLLDRRLMYKTLQANGIPVVRHAFCERDENTNALTTPGFEESEDYVIVGGVKISKPLVEKPVDAEDHRIYIYYPSSVGGGSKRLFRKVKDRSSSHHPDVSSVRRSGSYIYEEFLSTEGRDVKVYAVGKGYAHAEARKSPTLDGKVERRSDGKEQRYPILLSGFEKQLAHKIVTAFSQTVCGFDLLRVGGLSYVCDVNGWSFVKGSEKYYDDAALILTQHIFQQFKRPLLKLSRTPSQSPVAVASGRELRCVIAVIRHGDRTPKQKIKLVTRQPSLLTFFHDHGGGRDNEVKLKSAKDLHAFLSVVERLIAAAEGRSSDAEVPNQDELSFLQHTRSVLNQRGGSVKGINRKIQLKPLAFAGEDKGAHDAEGNIIMAESPVIEVMVVVKWGGTLTEFGADEALQVGNKFRSCMYHGEKGGLLRLQSTFRHDLKIYSSDEGRVQMTAAAFAKGLLDLEGDLAPILMTLVRKNDRSTEMLDDSGKEEKRLKLAKAKIRGYLNGGRPLNDPAIVDEVTPLYATSLVDAVRNIGDPGNRLEALRVAIHHTCIHLQGALDAGGDRRVYGNELLSMMLRRWLKLHDTMYSESKGEYDISKVPDVFDCATYDLMHNHSECPELLNKVYDLVLPMENYVVPQEYGVTAEDKVAIGRGICTSLLAKVSSDLENSRTDPYEIEGESLFRLDETDARDVKSPSRRVKTRLYFTSESLIHTLVNVLCYSPASFLDPRVKQCFHAQPGLGFLSQLVLAMYEDTTRPLHSPDRYVITLLFSSGAHGTQSSVGGRGGHRLSRLQTEIPLGVFQAFCQIITGDSADDATMKKFKTRHTALSNEGVTLS